jgi:hypothetical protein
MLNASVTAEPTMRLFEEPVFGQRVIFYPRAMFIPDVPDT